MIIIPEHAYSTVAFVFYVEEWQPNDTARDFILNLPLQSLSPTYTMQRSENGGILRLLDARRQEEK